MMKLFNNMAYPKTQVTGNKTAGKGSSTSQQASNPWSLRTKFIPYGNDGLTPPLVHCGTVTPGHCGGGLYPPEGNPLIPYGNDGLTPPANPQIPYGNDGLTPPVAPPVPNKPTIYFTA